MPRASSRTALCHQSKMKSAQGRGSDSGAADGPFVPTVTAIATAPDLKWMVLSTDISSVGPCSGAAKQKRAQAGQRKAQPSTRKAGHGAPAGRRKAQKEQLSPEEEERKRIRRERNKLAAAKCRNRRRELTDSLQAETDQLEEEKAALQAEISTLMKEKEQLELLLSTHNPHCKIPAEMPEEEEEEDEASEEPPKPSLVLQDDLNPIQSPSPTISLDKMPSSPLGLHQVPNCPQELEPTGPIMSEDSDVLLCSSAALEPYIDMKDVPMDDLGCKVDEDDNDDMDLLVPDIDLSASLGLTEWETLYMTMGGSLDPLSTPTLSPACGTSASSAVPMFDFPNLDSEGSDGKVGAAKAKAGADNSTLLAL
ncbi:proto-oncogene c-Fos [Pygocentrus nattereri]|uniref:BZIP domain-containing protein n=1 Tax=Pygocentrus nattereri TaxID=42514 RepID=A0AAR2KLW4_PYGNA|nr:proto-oncogene c-Fos [Pygocentrus nattereri]